LRKETVHSSQEFILSQTKVFPVSITSLLRKIRVNRLFGREVFVVEKHWESILKKLQQDGWTVRQVEAMHDGEPGWSATATKGKERHSIHSNDLTLAFQELEALIF